MKVSITEFKGIKPKVSAHLLDMNGAQLALNCELETGIIQGLNKPEIISQLSTTDTMGMFQYIEGSEAHWITSTNRLSAVRSPITNDPYERMYFTGETQPRYYHNDYGVSFNPANDYKKMGIPTPTAAPHYDSGHTGSTNYVAHFYTYVNRYGIEGPPSPIVEASTWDGSSTIVLHGFTQATGGYACVNESGSLKPKIRLYRVESDGSGLAAFQFVKDTEVDSTTNYSTLTISDDVASANLGEVCPSVYWYAPNTNMKGLIGLSNGIFAGFYGNTLFLSDPYLPEAWPTSYNISFSESIIGLGYYGTNIIVCTDEGPYLVYGSHPSQMTKQKIPGFYPCLSIGGIVSTEHGVFYPSHEGIMLVNANGISNVTKDLLTVTNMVGYYPSTWVSTYYGGKYMAFYTSPSTEGCVVLDVNNGLLRTLNFYMSATHVSVDDSKLYVIGRDNPSNTTEYIQQWKGDEYNFYQYFWKSKKFLLPAEVNLSTARVVMDLETYEYIVSLIEDNDYLADLNETLFAADLEGSTNAAAINVYPINGDTLYTLDSLSISSNVTFKLYVDNDLKFTKILESDGAFRLPSGFRGRRWEVQLEGYIPIREVSLAPSIAEIMGYE